jgi:hypothetical protein
MSTESVWVNVAWIVGRANSKETIYDGKWIVSVNAIRMLERRIPKLGEDTAGILRLVFKPCEAIGCVRRSR